MTVSEKLKEMELHGHMIYISGVDADIHDDFVTLVQAAEHVSEDGGVETKALNNALEAIAGTLGLT